MDVRFDGLQAELDQPVSMGVRPAPQLAAFLTMRSPRVLSRAWNGHRQRS